ncbi:MAG: alpha/beta hydrolase fold domain-containing protein [Actinomycetales bacterium]|nr:alpha/beta hydrolase fold domain-containing protein [Actinomycetales bacterium]
MPRHPNSPTARLRRALVAVERRTLAGPHGELPVRIYRRRGARGTSPIGLVWAHGGGFAYGDLDMPEADRVARDLAARGIPVVSVGYRLAPPFRNADPSPRPTSVHFPVASEEVTAAFWFAARSGSAPGRGRRRRGVAPRARGWALGGASAGADLAAGAALRLRDEGGPTPRMLLLVYPIVHLELPPASAELEAAVASLPRPHRFDADGVRRMNANYLGHPGPADSPYAFPGGHDLAGLPPVRILNAEADTLRASGEAFGAELAAAGVDVEMVTEPGTEHGHLNQDVPEAVVSTARLVRWLREAGRRGS